MLREGERAQCLDRFEAVARFLIGSWCRNRGANNICDPSKPYRDRVVIEVALSDAGRGYLAHVADGGTDELSENPLYLVVKTEETTWSWLLCLGDK